MDVLMEQRNVPKFSDQWMNKHIKNKKIINIIICLRQIAQVGKTRVNKVREGNKRPQEGRELNKDDGILYNLKVSKYVRKNSYKKVGNVK